MRWRRWNNVLHRDLGYLCVGLTLVYALSGVAVNHVDGWNPSYEVTRRSAAVGLLPPGPPTSPETIRLVLARLGLAPDHRAVFRPDSATVRIFLDDGTVDLTVATGEATVELVRPRPVLHAVNFLHLNHPKRLWTWLADLYAVALGLLAVTGLFVLKGRKGIAGRGAWLTALGAAVPLVALWLYR